MEPESTVLETTPDTTPARPGLGWRGLIEVFYKPSQFFAEIKQHPRILAPYISVLVAVVVSMYFLGDLIIDVQIEAMRNNPNARPEQMPSRETMKMIMLGFGSVMWLLYPLLVGGLAILVGNFFMGGNAKFKQVLSVMLYGAWIFTIGGIITMPLALAKDSLHVGLSLGVLIPDPSFTDPLYLLLTKISVFQIWEIVAVGIGLSMIYGFSRNKGYITAVLSIALISIIHVLQTAIFA